MKKYRQRYRSGKFHKSNKIEVFKSLSENFGSKYGVPGSDADDHHKMNFQLDRLFTVIHDN